MFVRHIRFPVYCLQYTFKMANISPSTLNTLNNKIYSIERTISSLQSDVAEIKNLLRDLHEGNSSNPSKKRKFSNEEQIGEPELSSNKINCKFMLDDNGYVQVYTDGACENNGQKKARAGLGVWFGHNHPLNVAEPVKRRPTNNVGEIEACTRAIQQAHSNGVKKLCINTDSEFTINCITKWIHGWKKRGWMNASGKPVINKDELIELDNSLKLMDDIKWNHVRGHKGIEGNEAADELARKGATMYKSH